MFPSDLFRSVFFFFFQFETFKSGYTTVLLGVILPNGWSKISSFFLQFSAWHFFASLSRTSCLLGPFIVGFLEFEPVLSTVNQFFYPQKGLSWIEPSSSQAQTYTAGDINHTTSLGFWFSLFLRYFYFAFLPFFFFGFICWGFFVVFFLSSFCYFAWRPFLLFTFWGFLGGCFFPFYCYFFPLWVIFP